MKVIGFSGYSGSGKTTLVERLIPVLKLHGQRVSVVKHAHHKFDIDHPALRARLLHRARSLFEWSRSWFFQCSAPIRFAGRSASVSF